MVGLCRLTITEEGRGKHGSSSLEVTKTIRNGAVSNQLTDGGKGGECVGGGVESVTGDALYSVYMPQSNFLLFPDSKFPDFKFPFYM